MLPDTECAEFALIFPTFEDGFYNYFIKLIENIEIIKIGGFCRTILFLPRGSIITERV